MTGPLRKTLSGANRLRRIAPSVLQGVKVERRHRTLAGGAAPVYVDVGSAGGTPYQWRRAIAKGLVRAYGVDPQEEYQSGDAANMTAVRCALGARDETQTLWETAFPQCSSLREPNEEVLSDYPAAALFRVVGTSQVDVRRADTVWKEQQLPAPDLLKIDVQGLELEVLEGFGNLLDHLQAIELESHFRELYKGQALFRDVHDFLTGRGFALRHIAPQGPFEGELVEANTFWIRRGDPIASSPTAAFWEDVNGLPSRYRFRSAQWRAFLTD